MNLPASSKSDTTRAVHPSCVTFYRFLQEKSRYHQAGFTLIEVMVVVVIIGLLSSIVATRVFTLTDRARYIKAQAQISQLESALKSYQVDNGHFPTTAQGLDALIVKPSAGNQPGNWRPGGYLDKQDIPLDPWGQAYVYISPGVHSPDYDLKSLGADGLEGGEDYDRDIESWRLQ